MSYVFNMVGGGSGGLQDTDALLIVQAPAGSVVTITKGGMTKTDHGHENADDNSVYDYYFLIHQSQFDSVNPWTVTATLGTDTASDTVMISSNKQYDLALSYRPYIYRRGYIDTALTGGLTNSGYTYSSNALSPATYNADSIYITANNCAGTSQAIDLTDYSTIYYVSRSANPSNLVHPWLAIASTKNLSSYAIRILSDSTAEKTLSADISSLNGYYYIAALSSSGEGYGYVYEIYLE